MATLVNNLVPDQLWAIVEPLLPAPPRRRYGGWRRTIPDPICFAVKYLHGPDLHPMRLPAPEFGCGCPATGWRRLTVEAAVEAVS